MFNTHAPHNRFFPLVGLLAFSGCADARPEPTIDGPILQPPAAGYGVQYRMVTSVDPGAEVEHCQFFRAPPEGLNIQRSEIRFTEGSHHALMYLTPYKDIPTANDQGEAIDTSGVFDCTSGATYKWSVNGVVGGSQDATGDSLIEFPPGVAMKVAPNGVFLMNAHYINPSPEALHPEVRLNLHSIPHDEVVEEGGVLFFYNAFIRVPELGAARATMSCAVPEDITLVAGSSHMHRRGVGYEAAALFAGGSVQPLHATTAWEDVPVTRWPGGLVMPGGSRIEYFCDYENAEARTVWQGPRTSDEMCMFIATYYPARPYISGCSIDAASADSTRSLGADWVGGGTASCSQTLQCIAAMGPSGTFQQLTACVLDAAPSESELVSDLVRCQLTNDNPGVGCAKPIAACQKSGG